MLPLVVLQPPLLRHFRLIGELHDANRRDSLHRLARIDAQNFLFDASIRRSRVLAGGDDVAVDGELRVADRSVGADGDGAAVAHDVVVGAFLPGRVVLLVFKLAGI